MRRTYRLMRSVGVFVAVVAMTTAVVAKSRREERHTLKTFHPCPRGVCADIEIGRFVDLENPTFLVDPAGESHVTTLEIDTASPRTANTTETTDRRATAQSHRGRLLISAPGDLSFACDHCIHRQDVDRTIVQLRSAKLSSECLGGRRALQGIAYDATGQIVVSCVTITDTQVPPPG